MGIASALFGAQNPFSQYVDQNHAWLSNLGAGLAAGPTFEQGLSNAARLGPAAQLIDAETRKAAEADKQRQDNINYTVRYLQNTFPDLAEAVNAGLPISDAWNEAFKRQSPGYGGTAADPASTATGRAQLAQQYGLTGQDAQLYILTGKMPDGNQTARAGVGQPVYFQNIKDPSQIRAVQPMTTGAGQDMLTGGTLPGDPGDWRVVDPATMAGTKATTAADAKNAAAARAALPGAQQAFDIANKAADALLNDSSGMAEQFGNTMGFPNQWMPVAAPGSNMARFRAELEQGQGNAFLQARQVLKGAGQVTDYEGAKAEAAYSRMALAAKNNNQQEFIAAVQDFKQAVAEGYAKLQAAANNEYAAGGPGITSTGGGGGGFQVLSVTP